MNAIGRRNCTAAVCQPWSVSTNQLVCRHVCGMTSCVCVCVWSDRHFSGGGGSGGAVNSAGPRVASHSLTFDDETENGKCVIGHEMSRDQLARRSLRHYSIRRRTMHYRRTDVRQCRSVCCFTVQYDALRPSLLIHSDGFITAQRYASVVYAADMCLTLSVRLTQVGVLLKQLKAGSRKQHHTPIATLVF